jgi:hypothetical protein
MAEPKSQSEAPVMTKQRIALAVLVAAVLFAGGYVFAQAKNKFGTPSSIIHISLIQWKEGTPDAEKQKALDGVKKMAAEIPGIKNVWIKAVRVQPREYHAAFAIEFADQAAHDTYAKHPAHTAWREHFLSIREASISPQVSN